MAFASSFRRILNGCSSGSSILPSQFASIRLNSTTLTSPKLFICGLSRLTTDEKLKEAFSPFGQLIEAKTIVDRVSGRPKGFAKTLTTQPLTSFHLLKLPKADMYSCTPHFVSLKLPDLFAPQFNTMSDWPGGTSTPDILPSDMNELPSETQSYERLVHLSLTTLVIFSCPFVYINSLYFILICLYIYDVKFNTMLDWPSEISTPDILHSDIIESLLETQSQERQVNTMFNCCSGTSTSPVLPLDTIETLSEIQTHERQDISQHIRQENANSTSGKITKKRSKVWQHFELYKDENGNDWAKCKSCGKVLNGSSKLGTTHLNNHLKSCKGKRNGGGGGDNLASNSSDTIAIKEKPVTDQQLNHLFLSPARMNITEESSKQVHDAGQARNTECGPSHSLRTIKLGPWPGGVLGGTAWDFKPIGNAAIKEIEINHGQVVDSVAFTSIDRTTRDIIATTRVGGNGGQPDQISLNWPEEYLTLINGTINDLSGYTVIESLTFHTNRKKHGPYGYTRGTPFEIPLENGEIVGFFGRAGLLLDAIGFYVVPSAD